MTQTEYRPLFEAHDPTKRFIRSPQDVFLYAAPKLVDLEREEVHVIALSEKGEVTHCFQIAVGERKHCAFTMVELFRQAVIHGAYAIIIVHNHPGGDPEPSPEDRDITIQAQLAAKTLDIVIHDHVIIAKGGPWYSFATAGMM